ncbi:MAG TPA: hypothetical protein VF272_01555 [Candidatus Saccharimonadia bacterium]
MQLQNNLWIVNPFYIDIDPLKQLRIVGPGNHLFFGSAGLYAPDFEVISVKSKSSNLIMELQLKASAIELHDPVMGPIRRIRQHFEIAGSPRCPYIDAAANPGSDLFPNFVSVTIQASGATITYHRRYADQWYGIVFRLGENCKVERDENARTIKLSSAKPILITLETSSSSTFKPEVASVLKTTPINLEPFGDQAKEIKQLLDRTETEINHLVTTNKTSGFEYGTVFPRDWMEAASLGQIDLTDTGIQYMYRKSLEHVSSEGHGWHEDIVGEFKNEHEMELQGLSNMLEEMVDPERAASIKADIQKLQQYQITRHMIDIEPLYILGLKWISPKQLSEDEVQRLRTVAWYVLDQATTNEIITFKELPRLLRRHREEQYYTAGNWRDSEWAYRQIHPKLAPYDVNAVFYPEALKLMHSHASLLGLDAAEVKAVAKKWKDKKKHFRFINPDGSTAYALALYDIQSLEPDKYQMLKINHLDEAYDLFYGQPSQEDIISFTRRLTNPNYFYTPSGPLLVGRNQGYDNRFYHGEVIWTKQTAFTVAGLEHQMKRAKAEKWPLELLMQLQEALEITTKASVSAFLTLGAVPELHYDDNGRPRLYTDQPAAEGVMNLVQLWSAMGARRIIRSYVTARNKPN